MAVLQIRIALDWAPNPNHSGLFIAARRGLFAGVEVVIVPAEVSRTVARVVLDGDADMAFAYAGTVIEARAAGQPLISVAAVARHHWSSLVALRKSGMQRPADLAGKRYASFGHPAIERAVIERMIANDGASDPHFDLRFVRFASFTGLQRGDYDFVWIYDGIEGLEAAGAGVDLVHFAPGDYGIPDYYAPTIIAHDDVRRDPQRREAARIFLAALRKGYQLAVSDPAGALADGQTLAPAYGGWMFASDDVSRASQAFCSARYLPEDGAPWGQQSSDRWTAFPQFLHAAGALGTAPQPEPTTLFTNELFD